jgi:hypothetical protein
VVMIVLFEEGRQSQHEAGGHVDGGGSGPHPSP